MDPAAVEKALGKTTASGANKPIAQNKSGNSADTKAVPKGAARDTGTKVNPSARTA